MSQRLCRFALLTSSLIAATLDGPKTDLVVHEWGTFTSIAGPNGDAPQWQPLNAPGDLPDFVYHLRDSDFKGGLRGTVRMETPVLYFYSAHPATVSVRIDFPHGLITEWYPAASKIEPDNRLVLNVSTAMGHIEWSSVKVVPNSETGERLPTGNPSSHYYAARNAPASTLRVPNAFGPEQTEQFLFYRGVAAFQPPLSVKMAGGQVIVHNRGEDRLGPVILFQNHNGAVGYSIHHPDSRELTARLPETGPGLASLRRDLEQLLVSEGLFPEEAHAMVETWSDSWFEKGARVFYIVPRGAVDRVVPLSIEPRPSKLERVFVGRVELLTPETNARFHVL